MKLNIGFKDMVGSADVIAHIEHRMSFTLSRLHHEIDSISIMLSDINGPKRGVDKQCRVIIKPVGLAEIVITETREKIRHAIDRCLARASQSLSRKLKQRRSAPKQALPMHLVMRNSLETT